MVVVDCFVLCDILTCLCEGAGGAEEFVHTIFATVEAITQHPAIVIDHCAIIADHLLPSLAPLVFSLAGQCIQAVDNRVSFCVTVENVKPMTDARETRTKNSREKLAQNRTRSI